MLKDKVLVYLWFCILTLPLAAAVLIAVSVIGDHSTHRLQPSFTTALANFANVLVGTDSEGSKFLSAFKTSLSLSLGASILAVLGALPIARLLGTKWRSQLWTVAAIVIGARVVPATAPIPIFTDLANRLQLENSWLLVIVLYVLIFLPMACALLSAAQWPEIAFAQELLALDAKLEWWHKLKYEFRALGPDLCITGGAVFLLCWSDFIIASFFLSPGELTITRFLANSQTFYGTKWGYLGAAIILSLLPVMAAIFLISQSIRLRVKSIEEE